MSVRVDMNLSRGCKMNPLRHYHHHQQLDRPLDSKQEAEVGALLQDESVPLVYVAVEWLQDADAEGDEAKELETPSKSVTVRTPSWQTVQRLCQSLSFTHSSTCTVVCRPRRSSMK